MLYAGHVQLLLGVDGRIAEKNYRFYENIYRRFDHEVWCLAFWGRKHSVRPGKLVVFVTSRHALERLQVSGEGMDCAKLMRLQTVSC